MLLIARWAGGKMAKLYPHRPEAFIIPFWDGKMGWNAAHQVGKWLARRSALVHYGFKRLETALLPIWLCGFGRHFFFWELMWTICSSPPCPTA